MPLRQPRVPRGILAPAAIQDQLAAHRRHRPAHPPTGLDWADFAARMDTGDAAVTAAMKQAGVRLADAVVGLVNLLDLPRVVIGGRGAGPLAEFFSRIVRNGSTPERWRATRGPSKSSPPSWATPSAPSAR